MSRKPARDAFAAACAVALSLLCAGPVAAQTYLIDTGQGSTSSIGAVGLFAAGSTVCSPQPACAVHFQFLGARIVLDQAASIDSISLWIGPFGTGGSMDVKIRAEANGLPSVDPPPLYSPDSIYSKRYTTPGFPSAGWLDLTGYAAILAAGAYWITFEPVSGSNLNYSVPGQAPNYLSNYAYFGDGNISYHSLNPAANANYRLGVRVGGTLFPGIAFGTATRTIAAGSYFSGCCPYSYDLLSEGTRDFTPVGTDGPALTVSYIFVIGTAEVHARGKLIENGLSAGAYSGTTDASGAGRGIAFRTFRNMSDGDKTFRVNADLSGMLSQAPAVARAGLYAFDSTDFSSTVTGSGETAGHFLLDPDDASAIANTSQSISLDRHFAAQALLSKDVETASFPFGSSMTLALHTGFFTVPASGTFTVLYDVAVASGDGGGVNFYDTLAPAAAPFTDMGGQPVVEIVGVGPSQPANPSPTTIALSPATGGGPTGSATSATATVTGAGAAPVPDAVVTFTVTSGPNAGKTAQIPTDMNGEATFTYGSAALGDDSVQAAAGALTSSSVTRTWTCGIKGDATGDAKVNVNDVFYLINYLFAGGPAPLGCANVDADPDLGVQDVFYLINYLFAGGPAPV
jgi:hypothetical protein